MKIIKKSENYKQEKKALWSNQGICPFCNSVIEYNDLDMILRIGNRMHFIKCGCCYNILELNTHTHKIMDKEIKL